jgi:hypothetical protein
MKLTLESLTLSNIAPSMKKINKYFPVVATCNPCRTRVHLKSLSHLITLGNVHKKLERLIS